MRPSYVAVATLATAVAVSSVALWSSDIPVAPAAETDLPVSEAERLALLSRAQVWRAPDVRPAAARLGADPREPAFVDCRFVVTELGGTARKFDCQLDSGDRIRVKYGRTPEIPAEVAATRLLRVLGFGGDDVRLVERLRCRGCPAEPFLAMKATDATRARSVYPAVRRLRQHPGLRLGFGRAQTSRARRRTGRPRRLGLLRARSGRRREGRRPAGARGRAAAAGRLARALGQQEREPAAGVPRPASQDRTERRCRRPLAMLQDVGGTFGPRKVDLDGWVQTPIWTDRDRCTTDMSTLPYDGSTFAPATISEAGRRHLASLLAQLTEAQLPDLFAAARFDQPTGLLPSTPAAPSPSGSRRSGPRSRRSARAGRVRREG